MTTKKNPIQEAREAKKLSRELLAVRAAISYEYVRRLESDNPPTPSIDIARRVADALGASVNKLFPAQPVAAEKGR